MTEQKPMEWYDVYWHCSSGECFECGNGGVECVQGCAPFCPWCVGYGETKRCYHCREPLLDLEEHPTAAPQEDDPLKPYPPRKVKQEGVENDAED